VDSIEEHRSPMMLGRYLEIAWWIRYCLCLLHWRNLALLTFLSTWVGGEGSASDMSTCIGSWQGGVGKANGRWSLVCKLHVV
jgi:hypothetical protein